MNQTKRKTNVKDKSEKTLADQLNEVPVQSAVAEIAVQTEKIPATNEKPTNSTDSADELTNDDGFYNEIFERWENNETLSPTDFEVAVKIGSLESAVGYTSLFRQMHQAFIRNVAYYRSAEGGAMSVEDARRLAFHSCKGEKEAKQLFDEMMGLPLENLNFIDLLRLHELSPRVAERFWERAKREGRREFESGHLAANITFPVGYMKGVWNIARYLGVRESFIDDWNPQGGIEVAMVDMLAQCWFQWQYWLEQTVKRSETRERLEHPEYSQWMARKQAEYRANGWNDGYWNRPYVSEQQALEHAVQMADRFNRMFMRTLRQLRDLRRYSPVTINNANQVNIASDGGQQINVANEDGKTIT